MAIFDQLGKKITQTGQSAVQKTKDMAEISKINSMISDEEKNINNNYYQIGKLFVSLHSNDCENEFKGMVDSVQQSIKKISEYKEKVNLIKGLVRCEKCGCEVPVNAAFCSSCGAQMPKRVVVDDQKTKCENCGNYVKKGMRFCTFCGSPMTINQLQPVVENKPETKRCPNCGFETTDSETAFCTSCGTPLAVVPDSDFSGNTYSETETPASSPENNNAVEIPKVKRCPNCGFETTDDEVDFCVECGTKL